MVEARSLVATVVLDVSQFVGPYREITRMANEMSNRIIQTKVDFVGTIPQQANIARASISGVVASTKELATQSTQSASKSASAFSAFRNVVEETTQAVSHLVGSLVLMGTGGAIAGFSWVKAMQASNYKAQVFEMIETNKAWKLSAEETNAAIKQATEEGWTTSSDLLRTIQATGVRASKFAKGKDLLDTALYAQKLAFAKQESLGGMSGEDIIGLASREFRFPEQKAKFALAVGIDINDRRLDTIKGKLKLLKEAGEKIDLDKAIKTHAWVVAANRVGDLQEAIGMGLAPTLNMASNRVGQLAEYLSKRPDLAWLAGMGALGIAAAGGLSMLIAVFSPLYGLLTKITLAKIRDTAATIAHTIAEKTHALASFAVTAASWARAVAHWAVNAALGVGIVTMTASATATGVLAAASVIATGGFLALAASIWAAMVPLLPFVAAGVAAGALVAGALGLIAAKAGILGPLLEGISRIDLSRVWKDISKGNFGAAWRDITKGFKFPSLEQMLENLRGEISWKMALDVIGGAMMPLLKPMLLVVDFLYKISSSSDSLSELMETGTTLWKKTVDFIAGLLDTLNGMWSWLMDAMPGARKEEERKKLEKMEVKAAETIWSKGTENKLAYEGGGKWTWASPGPGGGELHGVTTAELAAGQRTGAFRIGTPLGERQAGALEKQAEKWYRAPGFIEGLATAVGNAVTAALLTLPGIISSAIVEGLAKVGIKIPEIKIPYMDELVAAIDSLVAWLEQHGVPVATVAQAATAATGVATAVAIAPAEDLFGITALGPGYLAAKSLFSERGSNEIIDNQTRDQFIQNQIDAGYSREYAENAAEIKGFATGIDFIPRDMIGFLHKGERVVPASQNKGGFSSSTFHINLGGIRIDKVSSDIDMNRLLSLIDKQAQKSIKNAIAQRRT